MNPNHQKLTVENGFLPRIVFQCETLKISLATSFRFAFEQNVTYWKQYDKNLFSFWKTFI